jgi:hypothetical protein
MEIQTDEINDLFYETIYYTQTIHNSNELCIICQLDETEDGKQWDRYKIVCGHIFHTRCFRKWAGKKMCINCPYCGDIPMIDKHKYCSSCKIFGHQPDSCIPDDFFKYHFLSDFVKPIQEKKSNICLKWNCTICNSKVNDFSFKSQKKHFFSKKCINARNKLSINFDNL